MRKDVKVGMALALVVVILAGWYYAREDDTDRAIPLAEGDAPPAAVARTDSWQPNISGDRTPQGGAARDRVQQSGVNRAGGGGMNRDFSRNQAQLERSARSRNVGAARANSFNRARAGGGGTRRRR